MLRMGFAAGLLLLAATSAFAADANCPQGVADVILGYVTWMKFFAVIAILFVTGGVCFIFWGTIQWMVKHFWTLIRDVADILAHLVSYGLIVYGAFVPEAYQLWPVLAGCVLACASIFLTITLRGIEGDRPTGIFAYLTLLYGAVAIYYGMNEIGFLAVLALMGTLGFSAIVTPFCYSFGFRRDSDIAPGTIAALMLLGAYIVQQVSFPHAPAAIKVFQPGAYWAGSFVGFLGLLILSNKWYVKHADGHYGLMQLITIAIYIGSLAIGMIFGINALAGMAGTFFVFYAAAKLIEVPTDGAIGFGMKMLLIGGLFSAVWFIATQNDALIKTYITTTLPM